MYARTNELARNVFFSASSHVHAMELLPSCLWGFGFSGFPFLGASFEVTSRVRPTRSLRAMRTVPFSPTPLIAAARAPLHNIVASDTSLVDTILTLPSAIESTLLDTPLEPLTSVPLFGPAASVLVAYVALSVVWNVVAKRVLEQLLVPILKATAGGNSLSPDAYELGSRLGGGNYGQVYEGYRVKGDAVEEEPSAVVKVMRTSDRNSVDFADAELFMK